MTYIECTPPHVITHLFGSMLVWVNAGRVLGDGCI